MWSQQDEAASHTERETMRMLRAEFPNRLIIRLENIPLSRFDPISGFDPSGKPENFYPTSPTTLQDIKSNISSIFPEWLLYNPRPPLLLQPAK